MPYICYDYMLSLVQIHHLTFKPSVSSPQFWRWRVNGIVPASHFFQLYWFLEASKVPQGLSYNLIQGFVSLGFEVIPCRSRVGEFSLKSTQGDLPL